MPKHPTQNFREGQPRSIIEWTPDRLRAAAHLADGGSLRLAADLCDGLLTDDRIQGVLSVRVRGLLRLPIRFELEEGDEQTPEEEALSEDFWKAYPEDDLAQLCSWGLLLGVAVGEHRWEQVGDRVIPRLHVFHPRWLRYDWTTREWKLTIDGGAEITIQPGGDGKWILYTPYGESRPWAHAPWKALGLAWVIKLFALQDWARHSESHGSPVKVGTVPAEAKAETRKEFASDIDRLVSDAAIALPAGYDLKYVEATAKTWEQFPALIGWADKAAAICLSGGNLTSDVSGAGSYAAAQVHQAIASHLIESDEATLSTTLHEQSLTWWAAFNFGDADRAPWVRWDTTPPTDKRSKAETLRTFGEAITQLGNAGIRVDTVALARDYGIPLREDVEDEDQSTGEVFGYHLEFGVLTRNEIRARLGLPPIAGGDIPPQPMAAPQAEAALRALKAEAARTGWRRTVKLASGRDGPESFVDGQAYAEALAEKAREAAADVMAADVAQIRKLIEQAKSPDELKAALTKTYESMDSTALQELTRRTLLLGELSGRYAMQQEVIDAE